MEELNKINRTVRDGISTYSNAIGMAAVFAVYLGLSVMSGKFSGEWFFANFIWIDWVIWILQPLITAVVGTMMKSFMKKEGIKQALLLPAVDNIHQELLLLQCDGAEEKIPDSYETYYNKGNIASFTQAFVFSILLSALAGLLIVNISVENILRLFITLGFWIGLGMNDYNNMYNYVKTKHIVYMRKEIKLIKEAQENERRNKISGRDNETCTGTNNEECI